MKRARWLMSVGLVVSQTVLLGCNPDPPPIPFAQSGERYHDKIDFARLEHESPLTPADLMKITPDNLKGATQEQVDQIYARPRHPYTLGLLRSIPRLDLGRQKRLVPIEGLPFSSIERQVGVYYLRHQPLSQAGARFVALCRERWNA